MSESLTNEQKQAISHAIFARKKIEAIKLLRDLTPMDLAEAKKLVEKYSDELEAESPEKFAPKPQGCAAVLVMMAVFVVLITFLTVRFVGKI